MNDRLRLPSRRETAVFAAATGVIAAHTVVDAFLAPQQGTTWTDHLAPGLVPLAMIAAANAAYPHLRAGMRACIAALFGVFSAAGAGLAFADATRTFRRPSDWTGFLLAPASIALLGLAVLLLWRSRKRYGHRYLRRAAVVAGVIVGAYWFVVPVTMALVATHRPRADVRPANLGAPYRSVTIRTVDGLDLTCWYVGSRNGAAVISFPTRLGKLPQARMLARHGFGVLVIDMRGYEGSDGSPNAFGWGATRDIDAAVTWLQHQPDVREGRIGGIGFSVGGEMMLEAAAENPGLKAVVSEGAGERSVRETMLRGWRDILAVPSMATEAAALAVFSQTAPPPSLKDVAGKIAPRAVLFIYAGHGAGGEDLNPIYYRAAKQPKAIWKIPEAHHTGGNTARPTEYELRITRFFHSQLLSS
jgi:dienelactone hydrolase